MPARGADYVERERETASEDDWGVERGRGRWVVEGRIRAWRGRCASIGRASWCRRRSSAHIQSGGGDDSSVSGDPIGEVGRCAIRCEWAGRSVCRLEIDSAKGDEAALTYMCASEGVPADWDSARE